MKSFPRPLASYLENINDSFFHPDLIIKKFSDTPYLSSFISYAIYLSVVPSLQTLFAIYLENGFGPSTLSNLYLIFLYPFCFWILNGLIVHSLSRILRKKGSLRRFLSGTGFTMLAFTFIEFFVYMLNFEVSSIGQRPETFNNSSPLLFWLFMIFYLGFIAFAFIAFIIFSYINFVSARSSFYVYNFSLQQQVVAAGISAFLPPLLGQGNFFFSTATYVTSSAMIALLLYLKKPEKLPVSKK